MGLDEFNKLAGTSFESKNFQALFKTMFKSGNADPNSRKQYKNQYIFALRTSLSSYISKNLEEKETFRVGEALPLELLNRNRNSQEIDISGFVKEFDKMFNEQVAEYNKNAKKPLQAYGMGGLTKDELKSTINEKLNDFPRTEKDYYAQQINQNARDVRDWRQKISENEIEAIKEKGKSQGKVIVHVDQESIDKEAAKNVQSIRLDDTPVFDDDEISLSNRSAIRQINRIFDGQPYLEETDPATGKDKALPISLDYINLSPKNNNAPLEMGIGKDKTNIFYKEVVPPEKQFKEACKVLKVMQDKHDARTRWWKIFHPFKNSDEKKFLENMKTIIKSKSPEYTEQKIKDEIAKEPSVIGYRDKFEKTFDESMKSMNFEGKAKNELNKDLLAKDTNTELSKTQTLSQSKEISKDLKIEAQEIKAPKGPEANH